MKLLEMLADFVCRVAKDSLQSGQATMAKYEIASGIIDNNSGLCPSPRGAWA